jgi:hypothetical protein
MSCGGYKNAMGKSFDTRLLVARPQTRSKCIEYCSGFTQGRPQHCTQKSCQGKCDQSRKENGKVSLEASSNLITANHFTSDFKENGILNSQIDSQTWYNNLVNADPDSFIVENTPPAEPEPTTQDPCEGCRELEVQHHDVCLLLEEAYARHDCVKKNLMYACAAINRMRRTMAYVGENLSKDAAERVLGLDTNLDDPES